MKQTLTTIFTVLIAVIALMGCKGGSGSSLGEVNFDKDASYAVGLTIGSSLREGMSNDGVFPNIDEFMKGMKDGLTDKNPRFDLFEANAIIEMAFAVIQEQQEAKAMQESIDFMIENARKPGIIITPTGLQYEVTREGTGPKPTMHDTVLVHYEGKLVNGSFFSSSYTSGYPAEFEFDWLIEGLIEGIQLMNVGSRYVFYISPELAYGEEGLMTWDGRFTVPPHAAIIFDIDLLEINPPSGGQ